MLLSASLFDHALSSSGFGYLLLTVVGRVEECHRTSVALFALGARSRRLPGWLLIVPAIAAWAFMHGSGIHATIAGVLLTFAVPALARGAEEESVAERYEHRWRPVSAGLTVPVLALAAGVTLSPEALRGPAPRRGAP